MRQQGYAPQSCPLPKGTGGPKRELDEEKHDPASEGDVPIRAGRSPESGVSMSYNPTTDEVAGALPHVAYEVKQTLGLLQNLNSCTDGYTKNARLEALLLHARVLLDFFEHTRREKDNVLATAYGYPASEIKIDDGLRNRLNKDLAHLTYSRLQRQGAETNWDLGSLLKPILVRFSEFADHVVETKLNMLPAAEQTRWRVLAATLKRPNPSP